MRILAHFVNTDLVEVFGSTRGRRNEELVTSLVTQLCV